MSDWWPGLRWGPVHQQRSDGAKIPRGNDKKIPRRDRGARAAGQTTPRSWSDCSSS